MDEQKEFIPTREQVEAAINADEPDEALSVLTTEEEKRIGAKLIPALAARINAKCEADAARKLAQQTQELISQNERMMKDEMEKLRASIKPPDPKELEQLLSQEYGEVVIELPLRAGKQTFTLRELPQACEKKMLDIIAKRIVPQLKELAAQDWAGMASNAAKLQKVIDILPEGMDMMAECCAICLDPFNSDGIDQEWVQKNIGSNRILGIIRAQLEVSKIRDFGSAVYQLLPR